MEPKTPTTPAQNGDAPNEAAEPTSSFPPVEPETPPMEGAADSAPPAEATSIPEPPAGTPPAAEQEAASQDEGEASPKTGETPPQDGMEEAPEKPVDNQPEIMPDPLPVSAPKSQHRGKLIGLIAAAVVVLVSGGTAAAYYYVVNTPQNVLNRSLMNVTSDNVKSENFSGTLNVEDAASKMAVSGTFIGASDTSGAYDLSAKLDVMVANISFDVRSTDGKTVYLKVGGLDGLSQLLSNSSSTSALGASAAAYAPLIGSVNGQWIEINQSLLKQMGASSYAGGQLTQADKQKMFDAYKSNRFLVVKEKMADATIKGNSSYHLKVGVDKDKLKSFVAALKAANLASVKITDSEMKSLNASLDKVNLDKYTFEVWIAKKTMMIDQVSVNGQSGQTKYTFVVTIDSYNQPVKVEKPAGAKSILDVMGGLLGGASGLSAGQQ